VAPCLLLWAWLFPLLPVLLALIVSGSARRRLLPDVPGGDRLLSSQVGPWVVRAALAVLFVLSARGSRTTSRS
jgi:hypothetical protein